MLHEDDDLLVVNKPAGFNTHAPSPYAGEGIYEWLRHREPRWARLAIIHRLDKETSGVMVFAFSEAARKSLTEQFTSRAVHKKYHLLTDRTVPAATLNIKTALVRAGEKYLSRPVHAGAQIAETRFRVIRKLEKIPALASAATFVEAEPLTGRTHQIRAQAAAEGFPVLGDTLYGGTAAPRVCLHAAELTFEHPTTGKQVTYRAEPDFSLDARAMLRTAIIDSTATDCFRAIHGASDNWPGLYVDRLGEVLLAETAQALAPKQTAELIRLKESLGLKGIAHKRLVRQSPGASGKESSPQIIDGEAPAERFVVRENGAQFELSFSEGYSVGLFLDQRDNRRRLLTGHVAADFDLESGGGAEVLNTFAYTCGFSVCAAKAGARTTSVDLSAKYLDWGRRNFALNGMDAAQHEFLHGDVFDWFRRMKKRERRFDVMLFDPPTFSRSKTGGVFRVEKDYGRLVAEALPMLKPDGVVFVSTNAADWAPEDFLATVENAIAAGRRKITQRHYVPQPPDFPVSRMEPAYLKTSWFRVD